ncbi:response regulator [Hankyongella ginsenosidimutans]|uniref:response regulator n=1 Tax=Hankyongella ginsenosidimutans TaxID=1763828 RepID=UPI002482152F|nr:response regulator [Hankyongella ginsenosidimutans]
MILDIVMPEMDGFEVCRRLKSDPHTAHIPVLMMTGVDGPAERGPGLEAGADDFLVKPIVDLELQARVRSLLRLKLTLDELRSRSLTDLVFTNAVGATPARINKSRSRCSPFPAKRRPSSSNCPT